MLNDNKNNNKDIFFIADLCQITSIKKNKDKNNKEYIKYIYKKIDKKIVYYKNNNYTDIETNEKYTTEYNKIDDKFIKIGNIIPFSSFLKSNRIKYKNNDIKNKKKVKELYNKYKE